MTESIPNLSEDDFVAILLGVDQVGLINLAEVEYASLDQGTSNLLDDKTAIHLDGTVHFSEDLPPVLRTKVWLTWTENAFVTFYAIATDQNWAVVEEELLNTKASIQLP